MKQPEEDVRNSSRVNNNHKPLYLSLTVSFLLTNSFFTAVSRVHITCPVHRVTAGVQMPGSVSDTQGPAPHTGPVSALSTLRHELRSWHVVTSDVSCTRGQRGSSGIRASHPTKGILEKDSSKLLILSKLSLFLIIWLIHDLMDYIKAERERLFCHEWDHVWICQWSVVAFFQCA